MISDEGLRHIRNVIRSSLDRYAVPYREIILTPDRVTVLLETGEEIE